MAATKRSCADFHGLLLLLPSALFAAYLHTILLLFWRLALSNPR